MLCQALNTSSMLSFPAGHHVLLRGRLAEWWVFTHGWPLTLWRHVNTWLPCTQRSTSCILLPADRVEIIANDQGNRTTPSYVAFTDTERLIGDAAKNQVSITNSSRKIYNVMQQHFPLRLP